MPKKKKLRELSMTKTFGKKRYDLGRIRQSKEAAKNVVKSYREDGYTAKTAPGKEGIGIYVRKKKRR